MDNIFAARMLTEHIGQICQLFAWFISLNIAIKPTKLYLGYPSVTLLGHHVNSFGLSMTEERLTMMAKITFPEMLQELETYLGMTGFLCQYIPYYASVALPLQNCKMELLKRAPTQGRERQTFAACKAFTYPMGTE